MKYRGVMFLLATLCLHQGAAAPLVPAQLHLRSLGSNMLFQVRGSPEDEWRFQASSDLHQWFNAPELGTLMSDGQTVRSVPLTNGLAGGLFYRVLNTSGLYDPAVLRTISLTFTQTNWQQRLVANYTSGSNLVAELIMDGITYPGVGVRYKGNTSYSFGGQKKSLNIEVDYTQPTLRLLGYKSLNLNNAARDSSLLREPVYFNALQQYTVGPKANFARLMVNGQYWGVYSFAQQVNGDLMKEWFLSNDGDRWKAPSGLGGGGGTGGGFGGGGGFASGDRALKYLGTNQATYRSFYELKTQNSTNPWRHLIHAADVLNNTPTNELRHKVEAVLAVDRWLWFLALENIFTDDDSYWNKGADYELYFEPETGRLHPLEYDGNEAFISSDARLNPLQGMGNANRPVISRLLAIPELRQRYLAHMRTVLQESFNSTVMDPLIDEHRALIEADVEKDTRKGFTIQAFRSAVTALKSFVKQRHDFLVSHAELSPVPPTLGAVSLLATPAADAVAVVTAEVQPYQAEGIDSVWLYYRAGSVGRFTSTAMLDDGEHNDGQADDQVYGATIPAFPAGTAVHYYIEARSGNRAKAARFAPPRAEQATYQYRVTTPLAESSPVVINELMADNAKFFADPQGEYDDWIELRNLTSQEIDLTGKYLSDDPQNPRKWPFPAGAALPANGFLLIWADENGNAASGLHTNFKLAAAGEQLLLVDTDENHNVLLDFVSFGPQETDRSYGRRPDDPSTLAVMTPTPGQPNTP